MVFYSFASRGAVGSISKQITTAESPSELALREAKEKKRKRQSKTIS
jgi:hypothetical protein